MLRILFISFILTSVISAQQFTADVDRTEVGENDRFQISFTFSGESLNKLKNFKAPSFANFRVFSGPNQSTSMQIINGNMSASQTFSYVLMPVSIGSFTIGPASIEYEDQMLTTNAVKITVVKGTSSIKKETEKDVSSKEIAENLFIRAYADKTDLYLGEQVTIVYKLYTRLSIAAQMSINKLPQYQGFWAEELETSRNINFTTEVVEGKQYRVGVLKKAALFPTQTGQLEVTPFELNVPVQLQRKRNPNNLFDNFFGDPFGRGEMIEYNARSNTIKLNVRPLPENGKPDSFNGAVGIFDIEAELDSTEAKTNEPLNLTVKISGRGNIKLLDIPKINLPSGFEVYEPKIEESLNRGTVISGTKTAEYLIVPRTEGKREIPPITFSFFNPSEKKYETVQTSSFKINIEKGSSSYNADISDRQLNTNEDDIRFIKTSEVEFSEGRSLLFFNPVYWAAALLPLLVLFGTVIFKKKRDRLSTNAELLKFTRARKIAQKRFKTAKSLMDSGKIEEFYSEISQALFGYLEDKLNISKSSFTLELAAAEMRRRNMPEELIDRMKSNAEKCEYIRFAPGVDADRAMQQMYSDLTNVIIDIERAFSR